MTDFVNKKAIIEDKIFFIFRKHNEISFSCLSHSDSACTRRLYFHFSLPISSDIHSLFDLNEIKVKMLAN